MRSRFLAVVLLSVTAIASMAATANAVRPSDFGGSGAGVPLVTVSSSSSGSYLHFNAVTQNNCNTWGCVHYNFPGNNSQWAGKPSGLSADCFSSCSRNVFDHAERGLNNQTVSTRNACAYHSLNYSVSAGSSYQPVPYGGGWTPLPFTGVRSAAVFPQTGGWVC